MELISAIPAAAAVPVRKAVGSVQNTGNAPYTPITARHRHKICPASESTTLAAAKPVNPSTATTIRCATRSPLRSERRPHHTMKGAPQRKGKAAIQPVYRRSTPCEVMRLGSQKLKPYNASTMPK